jgi:hypothetical protein
MAILDVRDRGLCGVEHELHRPADQVGHGVAGAAIRHMHHVHASHQLEQLTRHVDAGADAARSEIELARIGLGVGDELGNGGGRERRVHHRDVRHAGHAGDRRDVANEIEGELVVEGVVDRVRRNHLEQRVTVRRRLHHGLGADIAAGARPVLDDHLLTEPLGEPLRHQTGQDVRPAAGGEADDDADRLRRIGLSSSGRSLESTSTSMLRMNLRYRVELSQTAAQIPVGGTLDPVGA